MTHQELYQKMFQDIAGKSKCSIVGVFPTEDSEIEFPFTYSVGFTTSIEQPEILIVGLSNQNAAGFINMIPTFVKANGPIVPGKRYSEFSDGFDVIFIECDEDVKDEYTIQVGQYYGMENYRVLQMVWPDHNNKFPWEEGHKDELKALQPVLGDVQDENLKEEASNG